MSTFSLESIPPTPPLGPSAAARLGGRVGWVGVRPNANRRGEKKRARGTGRGKGGEKGGVCGRDLGGLRATALAPHKSNPHTPGG